MHPQDTTPPAPSNRWWDVFNTASRTPMNGDTKAVLMAVLSYANGPGHKECLGNARPGVKRLMEDTGLTRRSVFNKLAELKSMGWLVETKAGGGNSATTYRVQAPTGAPTCTPPVHEDAPPQCTPVHPTDAVPTQDRPSEPPCALPAPPSGAGEVVSHGSRVDSVVLDAVQALSMDQHRIDLKMAFFASVASTYGTPFAAWLDRESVSYGVDLNRWEAAAKVRSLIALAQRRGVEVVNAPAPKRSAEYLEHIGQAGDANEVGDDSILADMQASFAAASATRKPATASLPSPEALDAPEDPRDVSAALSARQAVLDAQSAERARRARLDARYAQN